MNKNYVYQFSLFVFISIVFGSFSLALAQDETEKIFWSSINCDSKEEVKAYLDTYPNGAYQSEAQSCLNGDQGDYENQTDLVKQGQELLKQLGYYDGAVDGKSGQGTQSAITEFGNEWEVSASSLDQALVDELEKSLGRLGSDMNAIHDKGDLLYVDNKFKESLRFLRRASVLGHAKSPGYLGYMYQYAQGVTEDKKRAADWYFKGAERGDDYAQNRIGNMHYYGEGVDQSVEQAVSWYRKSAEQGNPDSQVSLGYAYDAGEGIAEDDVQAVYWYQKAADQGNAISQGNMGIMYRDGLGVAPDYQRAIEWFQKATDQGDASSQVNLGIMYRDGLGVAPNYQTAFELFRQSAEGGSAVGQASFAYAFEKGQGTAIDLQTAIDWYQKAADQGDQYSIDALIRLGVQ